MNVSCPNCGHEFHAPHPHLTERGFVPVRLHRRKKRTLYIRREDLTEDVADDLDALFKENAALRAKVGRNGSTAARDPLNGEEG